MPRYFFNVENGSLLLDETGEDLKDLRAARDAALRITCDLLKGGVTAHFWDDTPWRIWVTDEANGEGETLVALSVNTGAA